jgi:hypothetical protein
LPRMHLTVAARATYLRPKLTMQFPQPLDLKLEPWRIPTNFIRNPINSFSAARGIAPWLGNLPHVQEMHLGHLPNQAIIWSLPGLPFSTRLAVPTANASNDLAQLTPSLISMLNGILKSHPTFTQAQLTNQHIVLTGGSPFTMPYVQAMHEPTGDFLLAGLFPVPPETNSPPLPTELMKIISSEPKLVYYNWEITGERIPQWESLLEVYLITSGLIQAPQDAPGIQWLQQTRTNLLNCQTEITLTAPHELTLLRSSQTGFTGLELTALQYWVDAPGFPLEAAYGKIQHPVGKPHPSK